jgi:D-alanyl-lipoteichoic acid acyltransferase DltB (MBOAT superfamily)
VRRSFWLAWIPIGLTLAVGSLITGMALLALINADSNPGLKSFLTLFGFFSILSIGIFPPFVLYKRRADHTLFWLAVFQLPMAIAGAIFFFTRDHIIILQPDPLGISHLLPFLALVIGGFPCLPTLITLVVLRARGLYGTTPRPTEGAVRS